MYHGGFSGAQVDLVIYGSGARPTSYEAGTTAVQYTANGSRTEIQKINSHCLGCHRDQNNSAQPFGDGKTPNYYAWDTSGGVKVSIDSKYSSTSTTPWGKYSGANVTPKNTQTKAYSAHGNAVNNQGGWNLSETWPNTRGGATGGAANIACFDCHNSHGSNVSGTTTSYTSATTNGGILKNTIANKGGYAMDYSPASGGSTSDHNSYNPGAGLCFDCHLTANAGAKPWGYSGTFGATQSIMGYRDTPYFAPGTSGSQQRYPYKAGMENQGGHFGASSALSSTDTPAPINGLCTPCHDPHGISPTLGGNASYAVPLLKGTFMTSPYKEDAAPAITSIGVRDHGGGSSNASYPSYNIDENTFADWNWGNSSRVSENVNQFGGLCLQCHQQSVLNPNAGKSSYDWQTMNRVHNTVQGWGGQGTNANNAIHSYTCSKCHTAHNSRLPRLMVTNCLDYSHRNGITAGGQVAQVSASGVGQKGSGWGHGQFPGGGSGTDYSSGFGYAATTCHTATNSNSWPDNQQWNTKTNWAWGPTSISPYALPVGSPEVTVTITGTGFQRDAKVSFNDPNITVDNDNVNVGVDFKTLTVPVTVGPGATIGAHYVTVNNPDGSIAIGNGLTVNPLPTISWATPYKIPLG
ncbi:MAG: IPT/TIG domain-containing protein, partial [Methanothrix sp.]|nr:IPT/TIG domain-containing protein [Methanothrix sp.]